MEYSINYIDNNYPCRYTPNIYYIASKDMAQVIVRKVIVDEKNLKKLKKLALVKSEYGNRNLYDTCEWRPITSHDLLLDMIRFNQNYSWLQYWWTNRVKPNMMYKRYYSGDILFNMEDELIVKDRGKWHRMGWAVLTKTLA